MTKMILRKKGNAPSKQTVEMSYIEKLEAFLDIPEEDFLEVDGSLKFQLYDNFLNFSRQPFQTKKIMAKATFTWFKNRNREEARELFMQAYTLSQSEADDNFDPDDQVLAWLMMHKYKKLLDGTSEDAEADEQELHNYFRRPVEQANPEVMPLLIMYYSGELSGIRSSIDLEWYLALLDKFESFNRNYHLLYFFPVSFTALDRIRWGYLKDIAYVSLDPTHMTYLEANFCYILMSFMIEWNEGKNSNNKCLNVFPHEKYYQHTAKAVKTLRHNFMEGQSFSENAYNFAIEHYKSIAEGKFSSKLPSDQDLFSRIFFYQLCAIYERKKNEKFKKRGIASKQKVLSWYQKAAKYSPELWHHIYQEARKIGKTDLVIEAAEKLHHYWLSRSPLVADYWEERLKSLSNQSSRETESIPKTVREAERTTPAKILVETLTSDESAPPARAKKTRKSNKKRPYRAAKATPGEQSQEEEQAQAQAENYDSDAEKPVKIISPMDIEALPKASIKVGTGRRNIADISQSDDQWQTKTSKKPIRPFEKVYHKNWNEKVYSIIRKVNMYRKANSPKDEYDHYLTLLHGTSGSMVGIERIWEEMGWLLLHQFDDVFALQAVREDLRKAVLDTAFKAKDNYFLPVIASYLGLDEMNSVLSPEEFYKSVLSTLSNEHFESTSRKVEFIHRLRSLASSVAHSFSLAAMASPRNKKLRELARGWYKAKSDLVTQEDTLTIIQQNLPDQ